MQERDRFQIGDYWLGRVPGSAKWYAFHYSPAKQYNLRESLRTPMGATWDDAKVALATFVAKNGILKDAAPQTIDIATVVFRYIHNAPDADSAFNGYATEHLKWFGAHKVGDLTYQLQCDFIRHLAGLDLQAASIRRYLTVLSAALGWARKNNELTSVPQIILAESDIARIGKIIPRGDPRWLTIAELAAFLDAIRTPHLWRYTMLALNTLARPDAITDLTRAQIHDGLISLNPKGRRQTKKHRPTIPITKTLQAWLDVWQDDCDHLVHYKGHPIANPKKAVIGTAVAAGLVEPDHAADPSRAVTPYTFRRTMARMLRSQGVPLQDVGAFLGHAIPGVTITELYADADPQFLKTVTQGIEQVLDAISAHTQKAPLRPVPPISSQVPVKSASKRSVYYPQNGRNPLVSQGVSMVGATRIELVTPSMSRKVMVPEMAENCGSIRGITAPYGTVLP